MESKVENQAQTGSNNLPNILDVLSVAGIVGGSVASLVTQQVAFAAIPISLSVALNTFNRRQVMNEMMDKNEQQQSAIALVSQLNKNQKGIAEHLKQLEQRTEQIQQERESDREPLTTLSALEENQKSFSVALVDLTQQDRENQKSLETLSKQFQAVEAQQKEMGEILEDLQKTAASAQAMCSANPNSADYYFQRGLSNEGEGKSEKAIGDYTQAIRLDASFAPAYERRGMLYAETGAKKAAVEDLRKASMLYFERGDIGSYEKTRNASKQIHALPNSGEAASHEVSDNILAGSLFE